MSDTAPSTARDPRWRRFLRFPLTRIVLAAFCVVSPALLLHAILDSRQAPASAGAILTTLLATLLGALGYWTCARVFESRKAMTELGPRGALREFGLGYLIGTLLFASSMLCLWLAGVFTLDGQGAWRSALWPLASAISAGVLEELLFRGVLFRMLEQWLGSWPALAISAGFFGLAHLGNPGASLLSAAAVMLEAGVLLAAAYLYTRRLWLPIGLHIAWNFTQGGVFGIAVSGVPSRGLLRGSLHGPEWLSGGAFGAEASVVSLGLCVAAAMVLLPLAARKGHIQGRCPRLD